MEYGSKFERGNKSTFNRGHKLNDFGARRRWDSEPVPIDHWHPRQIKFHSNGTNSAHNSYTGDREEVPDHWTVDPPNAIVSIKGIRRKERQEREERKLRKQREQEESEEKRRIREDLERRLNEPPLDYSTPELPEKRTCRCPAAGRKICCQRKYGRKPGYLKSLFSCCLSLCSSDPFSSEAFSDSDEF